MLFSVLRNVSLKGKLDIIDSNGKTHSFGAFPDLKSDNLYAKIRFTNKSIQRKLFLNPGLYLGEGYMDGEIVIEEGTIEDFINVITSETKLTNFDFISDKWRADFYTYLNSNINKKGYKVSYILQTSFKDEIKIVRKDTELVLDMHYGNDGFFSSAICSFCNNVLIWEEIKVIIDELKGQ